MRTHAVFITALSLCGCQGPTPLAAPLAPGQQPSGWDDDIRAGVADDLDPEEGTVAVALEAKIVALPIDDRLTDVWSYNGQVPGPTLRVSVGDRVIVTFTNSLPEPTTIHWHGLRIPAAMDGTDMSQDPILPGETFIYDFVVPDAGTFWYHPHINSSAQIGFGLYGAFIVEDPAEPRFGDDLVLVLSDMGLDDDGQLLPGDHQGWFGDYFGRQGNINLVNGRQLPEVRARVGVPQRWRIVNASRAKYARFNLAGLGFTQIGVDGGLLERPVADAVVTLPAGARADVVFEALASVGGNNARVVDVVDVGVDQFHIDRLPPAITLLQVAVTDEPGAGSPAIPSRLRTLPPAHDNDVVEQRFEFVDVAADDGNTYTGINGQLYADADHVVVAADSDEVWTLVNRTNRDHSFHLHGFFFEVLDDDGTAPAVRGLLDTVNVEPDHPLRIAIHFDNRPGMWMFHCHIIDHADHGMMRMLMVL